MSDEAARPWYETLFERDWYDYFAKGGPGSPDEDGSYARQTDAEVAFVERALGLTEPSDVLDLCRRPGASQAHFSANQQGSSDARATARFPTARVMGCGRENESRKLTIKDPIASR